MGTERRIDLVLGGLSVFLAAMTVLYLACVFTAWGPDPDLRGALIYAVPAVALALGRRRSGTRVKRGLVFAVYLVVSTEALVQGVAALGLVPSVHTYAHVPYGRIYYRKEGFANEVMNHFGWHGPRPRSSSGGHKVALIGDSFVLGIGVPSRHTAGALLDQRFAALSPPGPDRTAMAFGISNIGPAHYLELLKYAWRHFDIDEAVIVLFLGNDYRNVLPSGMPLRRDRYFFYELDEKGALSLDPRGKRLRSSFVRRLDLNHLPLPLLAPLILRSHWLTPKLLAQARNDIADRLEKSPPTTHAPGVGIELGRLGLSDFVFREHPTQQARAAVALVHALLEESQRFAEEHGIALRLVSIPAVPLAFYTQPSRTEWSFRLGGYDFEWPDRELRRFAAERGLPFVSLADRFRRRKLNVDQIHELYFNGVGHLTPAGHRFLAEEIVASFYTTPSAQAAARESRSRNRDGLTPGPAPGSATLLPLRRGVIAGSRSSRTFVNSVRPGREQR